MTESLIAPNPNSQGAPDDVAPPSPEQQAASDAADLIYRGPEAEAVETTEPEAPPAEEQEPVAYEPFQLPQGVEVDSAALEEAQSLFAEARLSQPQPPSGAEPPADIVHLCVSYYGIPLPES